jgi:hypothetical protein
LHFNIKCAPRLRRLQNAARKKKASFANPDYEASFGQIFNILIKRAAGMPLLAK